MLWNLTLRELLGLCVHILFLIISAMLYALQTFLDEVGARITSVMASVVSICVIIPLVLHARGARERERMATLQTKRVVQRMLPYAAYKQHQAVNDTIRIEMNDMGIE